METKEKFLAILKELMYERNISFKQLSRNINMNDRTIRRWFEDRSPKIESLIKISNYFGCSIDYLVGMSTTEFDFAPQSNKIIFTERYKQLKETCSINDARISERCNVSAVTVCYWNRGSIPSFDIIVDLCKIFDCSYEYIIGRVD